MRRMSRLTVGLLADRQGDIEARRELTAENGADLTSSNCTRH